MIIFWFQPEKVKFELKLGQSKPIFNAFKAIKESSDWDKLSDARKRIVECEYDTVCTFMIFGSFFRNYFRQRLRVIGGHEVYKILNSIVISVHLKYFTELSSRLCHSFSLIKHPVFSDSITQYFLLSLELYLVRKMMPISFT